MWASHEVGVSSTKCGNSRLTYLRQGMVGNMLFPTESSQKTVAQHAQNHCPLPPGSLLLCDLDNHIRNYCGWTRSCTTLQLWATVVCRHFQGKVISSRVSHPKLLWTNSCTTLQPEKVLSSRVSAWCAMDFARRLRASPGFSIPRPAARGGPPCPLARSCGAGWRRWRRGSAQRSSA